MLIILKLSCTAKLTLMEIPFGKSNIMGSIKLYTDLLYIEIAILFSVLRKVDRSKHTKKISSTINQLYVR